MDPLRINRFLARCGLGSRRNVEALVTDGRVRVNGEVVTDLARRIDPAHDTVEVDGETVRVREAGLVLLMHKPVGVVSSLVRQDQRECLVDLVPEYIRLCKRYQMTMTAEYMKAEKYFEQIRPVAAESP